MRPPNWKSCSEEQLWKYVAWNLSKHDIDSVLVGGAVVSIYTEGLYKSGDIDLITYELTVRQLDIAMNKIGFKKKGMHYRNSACPDLYIQSVSGPLGIGDDLKIEPRKVKVDGRTIKILTPTDCIRDRLSAYIYDGVRGLFDQAVLVARHQPFEDKKVKKWLTLEGRLNLYKEFLTAVALEPRR